MRKLLSLFFVLLTLLTMAPAALAESPVRVFVGITELDFDTPPVIEQGRTLVPLRTLAEALGYAVTYEPAERRVTLTKGDRTVELWVGFTKAKVNGKDYALEAAPRVVSDRTLVPLRFVSEHLGAVVTWSEKDRMVHVERGEVYARGLYETAQGIAMENPFADQKSKAILKTTLKMSGPDLPPGGLSMEMPMSMEMHLYKGEMLMSVTTSEPSLTGMESMTIKMALKDGKSYMLVPGTEQWMMTGEGSLEDALQVGSGFDMSSLTTLQAQELQGAKFRLSGIEETGGRRVARVDVELPTAWYNDLFAGLLGPLSAVGENMQMTLGKFNLSQWIDVATGKTDRVTLDMAMTVSGSEPGLAPTEMHMAMTGDISYSHLSEPIQFPDLSGAIDPSETDLNLD